MNVLACIEPLAVLGLDTSFLTVTQTPGLHMAYSFIKSCRGCRYVLRDGHAGGWAGGTGDLCVCELTNLSCPSPSCVPISLGAAVPEKHAFSLTTQAGDKKIKSTSVT